MRRTYRKIWPISRFRQMGIESIRSKLEYKIFDEYTNILKGMSSTRFNGCPKDSDVSPRRRRRRGMDSN
jgi:hypothetical protein